MGSGSVEVGFDSFFSYAASDQVMIHGQTWQHDGRTIYLFIFLFFLLRLEFRDSAALNVKLRALAVITLWMRPL